MDRSAAILQTLTQAVADKAVARIAKCVAKSYRANPVPTTLTQGELRDGTWRVGEKIRNQKADVL